VLFRSRPTAVTDQLRELARLKDDGIISEAEFNDKKSKLLEKM
jgi:cytochrome c-type biogenesis protein CcmH/NrfG